MAGHWPAIAMGTIEPPAIENRSMGWNIDEGASVYESVRAGGEPARA